MSRTNWKQKNGKWTISNNSDINLDLFNEFNNPIVTPNKSYLYMPVHNVNDIYEWYRIFYDAYYFSDSIAKNYIDNLGHGIGITMYANADRAKTIKAWFPNLVEVKATSTDVEHFYYKNNRYTKSSLDFIENFTFAPEDELIIDNTIVYPYEKILLRNQYSEYLTFVSVFNPALTDTSHIYGDLIVDPLDPTITTFVQNTYIHDINTITNTITLKVDTNEITRFNQFLREGSTLICIFENNSVEEFKIEKINITDADPLLPNLLFYTLKIENPKTINLTDVIMVADKFNGDYIGNDYLKNENGVYLYDGSQLILIEEMNMPEKVYNQIVYTYQGKSNMNRVFYLRRNEDKYTDLYSKYPTTNDGVEMIYSVGNPYLIECDVNYDIAMQPTDFANVNATCSAYNNNFNYVNHPTTQPFTVDDNIFRLMYLDYDVARKLQYKTNLGPANYKLDGDLVFRSYIPSISDANILTFTMDHSSENYLMSYFKYRGIDPTDVNDPINTIMFYRYNHNNYTNTLTDINNLTIDSFTDNGNYASDVVFKLEIPTNPIANLNNPSLTNATSFIKFNVKLYDEATDTDARYELDEILYTNNLSVTHDTVTNITTYLMSIKESFDKEIINKIQEYIDSANDPTSPHGKVVLDVEYLNCFYADEVFNSTYSVNEIKLDNLIANLNKTIFGKIYEFKQKTIIDDVTNTLQYTTLDLLKLRTNIYNYHSVYQELNTNISNNCKIIENFYPVYHPGYNITEYLSDYIYNDSSLVNNVLDSKEILTVPHNSNNADTDYFFVIKNNSENGIPEGTIIEYGDDYRVLFLENLKSNTFVKIDGVDNFIYHNEFNYETKVGKIVLKEPILSTDHIILPAPVVFDTNYTLAEISDLLTKSFDTTNNIANENIVISIYEAYGVYNIMKPDTFTVANEFINDRHKYSDLSGVVYKEDNELVYTFLKRDKKFKFQDGEKLFVTYISESNNSVTISGNNLIVNAGDIDGLLFNVDDTILLIGQTNLNENGYFKITHVDTIAGEIKLERLQLNLLSYYQQNTSSYYPSNTNLYKLDYELPYVPNVSNIKAHITIYRRKSDPRLNITFTRYAKLGVDNEYQPFKSINHNKDSIEIIENVVGVGSGINQYSPIRFVDGLSYDSIINNINGHGQYAWILNENVITENAVVGVNTAGKLVWYTGTWVDGVWCDGIWIQGTWENGIWVNGEMYSYGIIDHISHVIIDYGTNQQVLTLWKRGTWVNGIHYNGIVLDINWENGILKNGIIYDGVWHNGLMEDGIIKYIVWYNGTMDGGEFQTGRWYNGIMNGGIFGNGSNSNLTFNEFAIMYYGNITGPNAIFTTGNNNANSTIMYFGTFKGTMNNGTLICVDYNNSIINKAFVLGGFYVTPTDYDSGSPYQSTFKIDVTQWDALLGLSSKPGYIPYNVHHINKHNKIFLLSRIEDNVDPAINAKHPYSIIGSLIGVNLHSFNYNVDINNYTDETFSLSTSSIDYGDNDISSLNYIGKYIEADLQDKTTSGRPFVTHMINSPATVLNNLFLLKGVIVGNDYYSSITLTNSIIIDTLFKNAKLL